MVIEKHKSKKYLEKVREEQKKWRKKIEDRVGRRRDNKKKYRKEANLK